MRIIWDDGSSDQIGLKESGKNSMESKAEQGFRFPHSSFLQTKEFPLQLEKECGGHMAKRAGLRKNP